MPPRADLSQLDYSCLATDGYARLMSPAGCPCIPIKDFRIGVCYAGYMCSSQWEHPQEQVRGGGERFGRETRMGYVWWVALRSKPML